jgi:hypothetical protein
MKTITLILLSLSSSVYAIDSYSWQQQVNERRKLKLQREMLDEQRRYNREMQEHMRQEQRALRDAEFERNLERIRRMNDE